MRLYLGQIQCCLRPPSKNKTDSRGHPPFRTHSSSALWVRVGPLLQLKDGTGNGASLRAVPWVPGPYDAPMSTDPTVHPGQLSPDGQWRWDGAQWVPATQGAAPVPPPRGSRSWIWWVAGGCAVLLVIGAVGAGFGIYSLVNRFQHGGFSCLPSDFPSYPGAAVVNETTKVGNEFSSGDSSRC